MRAWHSESDATPQSLKQAKICNHPRYCSEITNGTKVHLPSQETIHQMFLLSGEKNENQKKKNRMQVEQCRQ